MTNVFTPLLFLFVYCFFCFSCAVSIFVRTYIIKHVIKTKGNFCSVSKDFAMLDYCAYNTELWQSISVVIMWTSRKVWHFCTFWCVSVMQLSLAVTISSASSSCSSGTELSCTTVICGYIKRKNAIVYQYSLVLGIFCRVTRCM